MFKINGKFLGALFLSFFSMTFYAQKQFKVGIDAGYSYSYLNADVSNLVDSKYEGNGGFVTNVSFEWSFWKELFVSTGVSYLNQNYKYERTNYRDQWYTKYDNQFVSMPLLVGGYLLNNPYTDKGVWIKVAGGVYAEYWASMKREGQYPVFAELQPNGQFNYVTSSDKYDFKKNENQLKRFLMGLQAQAQVGYSFGEFDAYVGYNYLYGLTGIHDYNTASGSKSTIDSHLVTIGAAYKF
jgi:hypothetical protein